jgi:uncharacterized protein (TIGR02246 family)
MQTLLLAVWLSLGAAAQSGVIVRVDWSRAVDRNADLAAVRGEYTAAVNAGDAGRAASLYAPDALAVVGGSDVLHGPAAVGDRLRKVLASGGGTVTVFPRSLSTADDVGSETGTYSVAAATADVPAIEGIYVTVYSRGADGRWRIAMEVRTGQGKW